jgi:hypothetical protein
MKDNRLFFSIIILTSLLFSSVLSKGNQEINLSREELTERLIQNIQIPKSGIPGLKEDEQKVLLQEIKNKTRIMVRSIFPEVITTKSKDIMERVTLTGILITEKNMEYNNAAVLVWLKGIKIDLAFQNLVEPLPPDRQKALRDNIINLRKGIQDSMLIHLTEFFPDKEIINHLDITVESYLKKINDQLTYHYKVP